MIETRRLRWSSEQSHTLPERIADAVRAAILRGDLPPGASIQVGALARSMKVSAGPLREALRQLAGEGLVHHTPRHGVKVRNADEGEARELSDILYLLDSLAYRDAAERMTPEALAAGERLHEQLRSEADPARWFPILLELRRTLLGPCDRPHLMELIMTLRIRTERYTSVLYATAAGREALIASWRGILDAMSSGEAGRVLAALDTGSRLVRAVVGMQDLELLPLVIPVAAKPPRAVATRAARGKGADAAIRASRENSAVRRRGAR